MQRIDTPNATVDGLFKNGDGTDQDLPTEFDAAWANAIQEELAHSIEGFGDTLNPESTIQLLTVLRSISFRCVVVENSSVSVGNFVGNTVFFAVAQDFSITGTLNSRAFVAVVPFWQVSSPSEITVTYGSGIVKLTKWQILLGYITSNNLLNGVKLTMTKPDGGIELPYVNAGALRAAQRIDPQVVEFTYDQIVTETGLPAYQNWQLKSQWTLNQVKRVYCADDVSCSFQVNYSDSGAEYVTFKKNVYKEFLCVGFCTRTIDGVDYEFAKLVVNGTSL